MITGWTINIDGLKGNERKATYFVAMIAPLYENWVITWGNITTAGEWSHAHASALRPNTDSSFGKRRHKGATAVQGLCFQWVEILRSASPHSFLWSAWEQFSRKANHSSRGKRARDVRQVGTCNLTPGNVVWLGYSSSLKKDASSYL